MTEQHGATPDSPRRRSWRVTVVARAATALATGIAVGAANHDLNAGITAAAAVASLLRNTLGR